MSDFWYLATPYSKWADRREAWRQAVIAAADMIKAGVPAFSPIVHSHPIALIGKIDPLDHEIWLPADAPLMAAARGLVVYQMDGWDESYGVAVEIDAFRAAGKPVIFWRPGDPVPVECLAGEGAACD